MAILESNKITYPNTLRACNSPTSHNTTVPAKSTPAISNVKANNSTFSSNIKIWLGFIVRATLHAQFADCVFQIDSRQVCVMQTTEAYNSSFCLQFHLQVTNWA